MLSCDREKAKDVIEPNLLPEIIMFQVDSATIEEEFVVNVFVKAKYTDNLVFSCKNLNTNAISRDTFFTSSHELIYSTLNHSESYMFMIEALSNNCRAEEEYYLFNDVSSQPWSVTTNIIGSTLIIYITYYSSFVEYPIIKSEIYTTSGILTMTQNTSSKEIDISGLERGAYMLYVTLKHGQTVMALFAKR